jgi:biopolymer transport protein ExbD
MKFPRNARITCGLLDPTPFAGVFFCLLIFVLLASLVYTPGAVIHLPGAATPFPGVAGPKVAVAMDGSGQFYYQNQIIPDADLQQRLKTEVARASGPLTLVVMADESVSVKQLNHLTDLATKAGIKQIVQATQPRVFDGPAGGQSP